MWRLHHQEYFHQSLTTLRVRELETRYTDITRAGRNELKTALTIIAL